MPALTYWWCRSGPDAAAAQATLDNGQEWGLAQWAKPLLHIVANGTNQVIDLELRHFLGSERYYRFQVELPEECDLDDATTKNFHQLRKLGSEFMAKRSSDLDQTCALLVRS